MMKGNRNENDREDRAKSVTLSQLNQHVSWLTENYWRWELEQLLFTIVKKDYLLV